MGIFITTCRFGRKVFFLLRITDMTEGIKFINENKIADQRVLLRVDFNVSLNPNHTIADDARIKQSIPTIEELLKNRNRLILVSHMGRPSGRSAQFSLSVIIPKLRELLPNISIQLVEDFTSEEGKKLLNSEQPGEILVLENMRFYPGEKNNDRAFSEKLASLADVYVNDAFAVSHRTEASLVGVTAYLPSFGGLLMKREIEMITRAVGKPKKPFVAIIGGAKISTKINLITKLTEMADYTLVGGGLANTFLCCQGYPIGKSYCEYEMVSKARQLLFLAAQKHHAIVVPSDVVVGDPHNSVNGGEVKKIDEITDGEQILDLGPETIAKYGAIIAKAKTIIWNGPVGYFENPAFRRGTDFIYYAITENTDAVTIVGGGDTLAAISKKEYLDKITHISTGGGAMLEFIEKGTLPGIEALKK